MKFWGAVTNDRPPFLNHDSNPEWNCGCMMPSWDIHGLNGCMAEWLNGLA